MGLVIITSTKIIHRFPASDLNYDNMLDNLLNNKFACRPVHGWHRQVAGFFMLNVRN